jgi:hypothetical protein
MESQSTERVPPEQIRSDFDAMRNQRPDIGSFWILAAWLIEPQSPFEWKPRRRPRPEVVIVLCYWTLIGLAFAAFNWT